ncbi:MAG: hypothetical protein IIA87_05135 [Nanoarchaeota archaeon]|nr:hypothetical protein [Nanoarchaeota archaeon]
MSWLLLKYEVNGMDALLEKLKKPYLVDAVERRVEMRRRTEDLKAKLASE